jgi:hypothetical protein
MAAILQILRCEIAGRSTVAPARTARRRRGGGVFLDDAPDSGNSGSGQGVYQIGEDQARSCTVIGTSGDILILNRAWSYAVQRGVGISIARA